ncbi:siphovirus Gp157 family protein [Staphylococcus xylosus]|uniref:siphovirus Gp157 family protein n=1 Tax=Staphylococcus xylosus TaxID=1288 RepID=UPI00085C29A9|nr:siphovirus Gp157 family protein [Staphylococcus xylosus]SCU31398.1 siphovirus Gp157 family protein [Staphylococcus xylosus]
MSNIYKLSSDYLTVLNMITQEHEELDQSYIDTLESIDEALEVKADNYIKVIKSLESDNEAIDEEIKRLRQRKTTYDTHIKRMKESLQNMMEETGKTKFKTALNSYNIQKNPPSLNIVDEKLIPKDYWVSQAPKLNKKDALAELKEGKEIPGVEVKQTRSLRVR